MVVMRSAIPRSILLLFLLAAAASAALGTSLADAAYERANWIFEHVTRAEYRHLARPARDQVRVHGEERCVARTDCSGFISHVLAEVAPHAYRAVRRMQPHAPYPQAKTYAEFFGRLPADAPRDGWVRVARVQDLRRGDIIAWEKGGSHEDHGGRGNSGHVMMVVDPPGAPTDATVRGRRLQYVAILVLDSSSVYHFPPETLPPLADQDHRDGLGKGFVRIALGDDGQPVGYWEGTYWGEGQKRIHGPSMSPLIAFARLAER